MAIKAIIFDCFGVLVLPGYAPLYEMYPQLKDKISDLIDVSNLGKISRRQYDELTADLVRLKPADVRDIYINGYKRNEPAINWLKELKASGDYKIGMLSNVGRGWMSDFFTDSELGELFDDVVLSSDVGLSKPAPRIFEIIAERLGVQPGECVMIDDRQNNIDGAIATGMKGIIFTSRVQAQPELEKLLGSVSA